jgi:hypothetical protein
MTIDEALYSWLVSTMGSGWDAQGKIQQNVVDQEAPEPRIWFQRTATEQELLLNQPSGIITTSFDVEVVSEDFSEATTIAEQIKSAILGYRGTMGTGSGSGSGSGSTVLLGTWEDHSEDYQPANFGDGDEYKFISSLRISIVHK